MKSNFLFFLSLFLFLNSCSNSKKCDCKEDDQNQTPIILTPENSISSEYLYASYLTKEKNRITEQLKSEDSGQLSDEETKELKEALKYSKKNLTELNKKIGGGICPPCPEDRICCSDFIYLRLNKNFEKVKLKDTTPKDAINIENQTIIKLRDLDTDKILIDQIPLLILDFEGKFVDLDVNIK